MFKIGPKMTKIDPKMLKIRQIDPKISKKCVVTVKFLLRTKTMGLPLKILLLVPKPTWKLLPSFRHNFHLCPQAIEGPVTPRAERVKYQVIGHLKYQFQRITPYIQTRHKRFIARCAKMQSLFFIIPSANAICKIQSAKNNVKLQSAKCNLKMYSDQP